MKKITILIFSVVLLFMAMACEPTNNVEPSNPTISGVAEGSTINVKVGQDLSLDGITAVDYLGNDVNVVVIGIYDLDTIGSYDVSITATDSSGLQTKLGVTIEVIAETCEENPEQEVCKTAVDKAREIYEGTIYNVDNDNNGVADWQEVQLELSMGFSYYGDVDETNAVWMNVMKFMEQYPNITVTRDPLYSSGWENGDDGLLLLQEEAFLNGTLPDIFFNPKGAETYDRGMTLNMKPYIDTDEEGVYITENALSGMMTYDNKEMWGIPWQGVGPMVALNISLLRDLGFMYQEEIDVLSATIDTSHIPVIPSYDWTYEQYEELRTKVGAFSDTGACVFPGVIDFSIEGPNYFDGVPNGYKGYNIQTQRFDFAEATNYGSWLEQVAAEAKRGWHYYDLTDEDKALICPDISDSWNDGVRAINTIYLWAFNWYVDDFATKGYEMDVYPFPTAPEGGESATYTYHDYYSLSAALEEDRVKAEAAYQLIKWITFGEEGLESRWSLIDEVNVFANYEVVIEENNFVVNALNDHYNTLVTAELQTGITNILASYNETDLTALNDEDTDALLLQVRNEIDALFEGYDIPTSSPFGGDRYLMDFIQGWPITSNPAVMAMHPLVRGFAEGSGLEKYNFDAFSEVSLQYQLSNANPYLRQIPAFASVANAFNPWEIKDKMRDESLSFDNVAPMIQENLNEQIIEYLKQYNSEIE